MHSQSFIRIVKKITLLIYFHLSFDSFVYTYTKEYGANIKNMQQIKLKKMSLPCIRFSHSTIIRCININFKICLQVAQAKNDAYPKQLIITESMCEVPLQTSLIHTIERLMRFLNFDFKNQLSTKLTLVLKYEFDGTNANTYKQISEDKNKNYNSIFCTSLLPLQLLDKINNVIYWNNPSPSSTRFCRPIKIIYEKETAELSRQEEAYMKKQIHEFQNVHVAGCEVGIEMLLTMIDGKVSKKKKILTEPSLL